MRPRNAWIPFLLFVAFLASGFVVFGKKPPAFESRLESSANESHGCPEESGDAPLPASPDLRVLEDELYRAITLALGDALAPSSETETAIRRALRDGLSAVESVWKAGDRSTIDAKLDDIYAKTRASLQKSLTEAQWQRLQAQGPLAPRR
ncbi:MAG: hypothetical protein HY292_27295 [Planctomycetes bacterium]|nr:hypothetical protein [Planctomycetota bacterium]